MSQTESTNQTIPYLLVTGGLGFIGSHVVVKLIAKGFNIVILDNLSNSSHTVLDRIIKIVELPTDEMHRIVFIQGDIRDILALDNIFQSNHIIGVMHFAALKSVGESQKYPELYHDVNVNGTINLLESMKKYQCRKFIYSSSATVYGDSPAPVVESSTVGHGLTCNYAYNKYDVEKYLIENFSNLDDWKIVILRYFNPIGAHPCGLIGEDPNDVPNNIFPYLLRVANHVNKPCDPCGNPCDGGDNHQSSPYDFFTVFGNDYGTRDGTCIRDYVHVQDLARAHVDVIDYISASNHQLISNSIQIFNVGTGKGTTVFELIDVLNKVLSDRSKQKIIYKVGERRPGDLDVSYANVNKIYEQVGFRTELDVKQMCEDGLNFVGL